MDRVFARRIWREERRSARLIHVATLSGLLATACWLATACLIALTVDRVWNEGGNLESVAGILSVMVGLAAFRALLAGLAEFLTMEAAIRVKTTLRTRLRTKLFELGPLFTHNERAGQLVHTVTASVETLDPYIRSYLPAKRLALMTPILVFVLISVIDPLVAPILLFAGPILVVLFALIGARTKELVQRRERELSWMSAQFLDVLQGLPTLKMFGRSREQAQTIKAVSQSHGNMTMDVLRTAFQTSLVLEWGATAATALVAITVSVRLMAGSLPFDQALAVLILTPEFFHPLRHLAVHYHAGSAGIEALERVYAVLDAPLPHVKAQSIFPTSMQSPLTPDSPPEIRFEAIEARYAPEVAPVLVNVSMVFRRGQITALIGPTGAGKSTIANLLLRFVEPTSGRIVADDVPIGAMDPDEWREQIALVSQHPFLFNGTVADNLLLARPLASLDEIIDAAKAAQAHDFIARLHNGYATEVGERGARLSGGQIQRIALARAFLKDAPVLILDEATSHLDTRIEAAVLEAVAERRSSRTTLLICHREAALQFAGQIYVIEDCEAHAAPVRPATVASIA